MNVPRGFPQRRPGRHAGPGTAATASRSRLPDGRAVPGNGRDDPGSPSGRHPGRPGSRWPAARIQRAGVRPAHAAPGPVAAARSDAEQAVTAIYGTQYCSLVRLAAMLVGDAGIAEKVVQDSFIATYAAWSRLRDRDKAMAYLRQSVMNRSRSVLRHRMVADRNAPGPEPDMPSAEQGATTQLEPSAVISAMRTLPPRQREAIVLQFYLDLSEAQAASVMGMSPGVVKCHTARAKAALLGV
jgi:RNA polymerase sigma-70 factor (sigma-E family)